MTKRTKFIIKAAAAAAIAAAIPLICSLELEKTHYELSSDKVAEPIKIAFLSDVHNSVYGKGMEELISAVDDFAPDAVVFGGDLYDEHHGIENSDALVSVLSLERGYDCFYAIGNHEVNRGDAVAVKEKLSGMNVTVLDGKYSDMSTNGGTVRFIGIDGTMYSEQVESASGFVSDECINILINHFPEEYTELSGMGFDFVLSGHAHGGQVRIPFINQGVYAPNQGLLPKYTGGIYRENGSTMILSRGLCRNMRDLVIPRVFNRPEAVFITINKGETGFADSMSD